MDESTKASILGNIPGLTDPRVFTPVHANAWLLDVAQSIDADFCEFTKVVASKVLCAFERGEDRTGDPMIARGMSSFWAYLHLQARAQIRFLQNGGECECGECDE